MTPFVAGPPTSDAYDTPARLVSGDAPVFPLTKLYERKGGGCVIRFTITEEGTTRDFVVVQSDADSFASHTIIAIRGWRFEPARRGGKPVPVTFEFSSQFQAD